MKAKTKQFRPQSERGVALIIAIFTMLLISVVATVLILTAGTASAIKTNYKSSIEAFYDAKAGLEEGRSRLWAGNPNCLLNSPNCVVSNPIVGSPCVANPMPTGQVCYIVNPDPTTGETVAPTDQTNPIYYDSEYATEFPNVTPIVQTQNSTSPNLSANIDGPVYKWVRITARTGQSVGVDANGNTPGTDTNPLFLCPPYPLTSPQPPITSCPDNQFHQFPFTGAGTPSDGSTQVLSVTALAVTPTLGSSGRRLLQYAVGQDPNPIGKIVANGGPEPALNQIFPAALTMVGKNLSDNWYNATNSGNFQINGTDRSGSNGNAGSCGLAAFSPVVGFGVTPNGLTSQQSQFQIDDLKNAIKVPGNVTGPAGATVPDVEDIRATLPPYEQNPTTLNPGLVPAITSAATEVVTGPVTGLPAYGSAAAPIVAVVQGDLTLNDVTGYGVLLVTGKLTVTGTAGWRGIVLVIGQGVLDGTGTNPGSEFDGAVLLARIGTGIPLLDWKNSGQGNGFYYDSCWISNAAAAFPYQVLSFREIQLTQ